MYNLSCAGSTCNVPNIYLYGDTTYMNGNATVVGTTYHVWNVGIWTASPAEELHIRNDQAAPTRILIDNVWPVWSTTITSFALWEWTALAEFRRFRDGSGLSEIWSIANAPFGIFTNNTRAITILWGGNVGIWTASPWAKLEVAGQIKITGWTPWAGKILTSDATGLATWSIPVTNMTPVFKHSLMENGTPPLRTASTIFQTVQASYGPFSYYQPTCPAGTTRQYKLFAEFVDNISTWWQNVALRIAFSDGNNLDFNLWGTWWGSNAYRNYISDYFTTANGNHASLQIRINGTAGPYVELRNAEIWTYCTQ